MDDTTEKLLSDFLNHFKSILGSLGILTNEITRENAIKEILNRFYCNLVSLENSLFQKDSLVAALIQRYNYELIVDFYYLIDPSGEEDKIKNFMTYSSANERMRWSSYDFAKKTEYLPPWVINEKTKKPLYRKLSDLAHSNIVSIRQNGRGPRYEYFIIKSAISITIVGKFKNYKIINPTLLSDLLRLRKDGAVSILGNHRFPFPVSICHDLATMTLVPPETGSFCFTRLNDFFCFGNGCYVVY